jgi:hypothetical protein
MKTIAVVLAVLLAVVMGYLGIKAFFEVADASDVGQRIVYRDGARCVETFRLKDASTVKADCTVSAAAPPSASDSSAADPAKN